MYDAEGAWSPDALLTPEQYEYVTYRVVRA